MIIKTQQKQQNLRFPWKNAEIFEIRHGNPPKPGIPGGLSRLGPLPPANSGELRWTPVGPELPRSPPVQIPLQKYRNPQNPRQSASWEGGQLPRHRGSPGILTLESPESKLPGVLRWSSGPLGPWLQNYMKSENYRVWALDTLLCNSDKFHEKKSFRSLFLKFFVFLCFFMNLLKIPDSEWKQAFGELRPLGAHLRGIKILPKR